MKSLLENRLAAAGARESVEDGGEFEFRRAGLLLSSEWNLTTVCYLWNAVLAIAGGN